MTLLLQLRLPFQLSKKGPCEDSMLNFYTGDHSLRKSTDDSVNNRKISSEDAKHFGLNLIHVFTVKHTNILLLTSVVPT